MCLWDKISDVLQFMKKDISYIFISKVMPVWFTNADDFYVLYKQPIIYKNIHFLLSVLLRFLFAIFGLVNII